MPPGALPLLAAGLLAVTEPPQAFLARLAELGVAASPRVLVVRASEQKMTLFEGSEAKGSWAVSTAANGLGEKVNTHQTPRGLHRIKEKIGAGLAKGAILDSREFKGEIWVPPAAPPAASATNGGASASSDLVLTRVLWLEGLEPGKNAGNDAEGAVVDSHERFIYIHGTNAEHLIGKPVSRGCIRMLNDEVIALFDRVEPGDLVWIEP
jgi:hypothetical protein